MEHKLEFKGTKGKWFIEKKFDYKHGQDVYAVGSKFDEEVLNEELATIWTWMIEEEAEANAKLIVAAPDLLEACKELLGLLEFHGYRNATEIYKAKEAIKKALG